MAESFEIIEMENEETDHSESEFPILGVKGNPC